MTVLHLLFMAICLVAFIIVMIWFLVTSKGEELQAERSKFERINDVEGILWLDGNPIKTYQTGTLVIDDKVEIDFFSSLGKDIVITDILYNEDTLFSYAPAGISYREKADYAIDVLKGIARRGGFDRSVAIEVEQIILEVDNFKELMKQGKIKQLPNRDYAWVF